MNIFKIIVGIVGLLIAVSAAGWPMAHFSCICPPRETWKDSICPKAQVMEAFMFLQMFIGGALAVFGFGK